MALTIYGSAQSRTMRVLWLATELQLEYEHVPLAWDDPELKQPPFLALNPAGQIPVIVDDGFPLAESLAIHMYLARKYGRSEAPLYPTTREGEATLWRWSLWAEGQLEPWVQGDARLAPLHAQLGDAKATVIAQALATLDRGLAGRRWILEGEFSVADLNVAAVLSPSRSSRLDLAAYGNVRRWLQACYERPAALECRRRHSAASS